MDQQSFEYRPSSHSSVSQSSLNWFAWVILKLVACSKSRNNRRVFLIFIKLLHYLHKYHKMPEHHIARRSASASSTIIKLKTTPQVKIYKHIFLNFLKENKTLLYYFLFYHTQLRAINPLPYLCKSASLHFLY